MAFEDIINKIKDDHQAQQAEAQKEHQNAVDKLNAKHREKLDRMLEEAKARAKVEYKRKLEQLITSGEANLRRELLAEKQELLDQAFRQAKDNFTQLDGSEYRKKFITLLSKIDEKEGLIIVGENDSAKLDEEFLKRLEDETGNHYERETTGKFKHGCILVSGRIRFDFTLDSLLAEVREKIEDKVINILFE